MRFLKVMRNIRGSFWYLPALYSIAAFILALITIRFDFIITSNQDFSKFVPDFLLADESLSQTLLSSISTALLTMTTITFSSILVVLTTFLSNFSPRTLQNFITDHSTQRVLGIFVGGFVYTVILLLLLRETDTKSLFLAPSFAIFVTFICLTVFIFFVHHTSKWIQVGVLISTISTGTKKIIEEKLKNKEIEQSGLEETNLVSIEDQEPLKLSAQLPGYINSIDKDTIKEIAERYDGVVRIEKNHGDFVNSDSLLFSVWNANSNEIIHELYNCISIEPNRAPYQNIEFGLTKLVEIALRAISPAVNDPNTAVNCIEQIGSLLSELGKKQLPKPMEFDKCGNLRLISEQWIFSDYLYFCFYQIRHYGNEDISIIRVILKALILIAEGNDSDIKQSVWEFSSYILEGIELKKMLSLDRRYLNDVILQLANTCERQHEFKTI
ncbi:DUF2254 domain-containing protein [Neobacillus mesonae]|uniref:DUF2254 domain-containing protein n=1 Tax=Neobacillus mesonae TaxID=1193713 RepID=UPI00203B86E9|nr:DUF2254 domain-containing protein [Neobacillus mesonae]MCM3569725.1 DUF2254 domain-containing protein [Neobacillus mesonae]